MGLATMHGMRHSLPAQPQAFRASFPPLSAMASNVAGRDTLCLCTHSTHPKTPNVLLQSPLHEASVYLHTTQANTTHLPIPAPTIAPFRPPRPPLPRSKYLFSPAAYRSRSTRHGLQTKKHQQGNILVGAPKNGGHNARASADSNTAWESDLARRSIR